MTELFGQTVDPADRTVLLRDQVRAIIESEIESGRWRVGDQLPTVREMAKTAGLSTSPIQQAVSSLIQDGLLENRGGRGIFLRASRTKIRPRSGMIGIILGGNPPGVATPVHMPFPPRLVEAICQELPRHGFANSIFHEYSLHPGDMAGIDHEVAIEALRKMDGVICVRAVPETIIQMAQSLELPIICLAVGTTPLNVPFVTDDNRLAMWDAVDMLVKHGHQKIGLVHCFGPAIQWRGVRARYDAFFGAMNERGLDVKPEWCIDLGSSDNVRFLALRDYLNQKDLPTALISAQNTATKAIYDLSMLHGIRIGKDISVIAMADDPSFGSTFDPPVSIFTTRADVLGRHAVQVLVDAVKNRGRLIPDVVMVRPIYIPRDSVATLGD